MPTSNDLHPLTSDQAVQLRCDLTVVEERVQDIAILEGYIAKTSTMFDSHQDLTSAHVARVDAAAIAQKITHTSICPTTSVGSSRSLGDSSVISV